LTLLSNRDPLCPCRYVRRGRGRGVVRRPSNICVSLSRDSHFYAMNGRHHTGTRRQQIARPRLGTMPKPFRRRRPRAQRPHSCHAASEPAVATVLNSRSGVTFRLPLRSPSHRGAPKSVRRGDAL
jgi:hypothetical protein